MNELGVVLMAGAARCLVLAVLGATLCVAIRRRGPATVALVVEATLTALVVLAMLAPFPWPRWRTWPAPGVARVEPAAAVTGPVRQAGALASPAVASGHTAATGVGDAAGASRASAFVASFIAGLRRPAEAEGWRWPAWVAAGYLAGVAALLARLAIGVRGVGAMRRQARLIDDSGLRELIAGLRAALGVVARVEARETAEIGMPATVGWRRPTLLLPADWRDWDETERRAVVAHELAHIRRGDYAAGVWAQFCVAFHFYQPVTHWLAARLRLEQELAADAWGARFSGGNESYLQALARLALRRDDRPAAWPARAFLPIRGTLTRRIEMLRDANTTGDLNPTRRSLALAFGTVAAAALLLAGLRGPLTPRLAIAQERPGPAGKRAATARPFDLRLVPAGAEMILVVRPAELFARPDLKPIAGLFGPNDALTKDLGITPGKVEQVTLVWLPQAGADKNQPRLTDWWNHTVVIVRATEEQELDALAGAVVPEPQEAEFAGQKYVHSAGDENGPAYIRIDGHTIVGSYPTSVLKTYLAARLDQGRESALGDAWDTVRKGELAMAIDAAFLPEFLKPPGAGPEVKPFNMIAPLWVEARAHALGVDTTNGLALDFAAACKSNGGAESVRKTLDALMILAGNALPDLRPGGAEGTLGRAAAALLRSATIERDGRTVRIRASAMVDVAGVIKALLLPAQAAARSTEAWEQSLKHMRQLGLGMFQYTKVHGHFPPAVVIGPDGKTPHSWRVELLPFLDQKVLFDQYKLDEPWDSPSNRKVLEARPEVFGYPDSGADATHAAYYVVVGPNTIFPPSGKGTTIAEVTDGLPNTILIVEAKRPIPWTRPDDIPFDSHEALPRFGGFRPDAHGNNYVFADGAVRFLVDTLDPSLFKKLLTGSGHERLTGEMFSTSP